MKPTIIHQSMEREGKGFSYTELKKVGLTKFDAKRLKLPIDLRRKTEYPKNVNILKEIKPKAAEKKPKKEKKVAKKK